MTASVSRPLFLIFALTAAVIGCSPEVAGQAGAGQAGAARTRILVCDLDNRTFDAELNWFGQAVSYYVRETLRENGTFDVLFHKSKGVGLTAADYDSVLGGEFTEESATFVVRMTIDDAQGTTQTRFLLTEGTSEQLLKMARYFTARAAQELGVALSPEEINGTAWGGPASNKAFQDFIKAIAERRLLEKAELYRDATRKDPTFAAAYLHLGLILVYGDHYEAAQMMLEKAVELMPRDADAFNNLGYVYGRRGLLDQAELAFRTALRLNPGSNKFKLNLGDVLARENRRDEARDLYREVLANDPDDKDANQGLDKLAEAIAAASGPQPPHPVTGAGVPGEAAGAPTGPTPPAVSKPGKKPPAPATAEVVPPTPTPEPRTTPAPTPQPKPTPATAGPASAAGPASTPPVPAPTAGSALPTSAPSTGDAIADRERLLQASRNDKSLRDQVKKDKEIWSELDPAIEALAEVPQRRSDLLPFLGQAHDGLAAGDKAAANRALGMFHAALGNNYVAYSYLKDAVKARPADRDAMTRLADVCRAIERDGEAKKYLELARKTD